MDQPDPSGDTPPEDLYQGEQFLGDLEETAATPLAPSVVAVVVSHNPGEWFEECLSSLIGQDYGNLAVLVIDAGSSTDTTSRIAAVAPAAFVRRLGRNPGFAAAANLGVTMVEGAAFYLLCHDDVELASNAVSLLVEEAYRSNAGIVGPKVVSWESPERLVAVGMGSDKFAVPSPLVEVNELDQEQHDGVRDVFTVPSGCQLVRSDLLAALGGFDEAMPYCGEDVDLCWRAHLAGARVLVAPAALVSHALAGGQRAPVDANRLAARNQLRAVLGNYGGFYLLAIVPQQVIASTIEVIAALVTGKVSRAAGIVGAYSWNLRNLRSLLAKRKRSAQLRQVTDLEIRRLQQRGSARFSRFVRRKLGAEVSAAPLADSGRRWVRSLRSGARSIGLVTACIAALLVGFGSRHLLTGGVAAIGEFPQIGGSGNLLIRQWWSGWRPGGLGGEASGPFGQALVGLAGMVLFGATGLARTLLTVGLLPIGAFGAWRLGRVGGPSRRAPAAATLAYLANPLPYNALANASWRGLAAYAAAPWVLRRLAGAGGWEPFGAAAARGIRPLVREAIGLGLVVGLFGALYPLAPVWLLFVVVALAIGSLLCGSWAGTTRMIVVGVLGAAFAALLAGPSLFGALGNMDPDVTLAGRAGDPGGFRLLDALHFSVGPHGHTVLSFGVLVAGLLGLFIGGSWRLSWAVRGWSVAAMCWAVILVDRAHLLDASLRFPPAEVTLAAAAAGLALAVAMGAAAFETDLREFGFGWRQLASVTATAALGLAGLPVLIATFDGRWELPRSGWDRVLSFLSTDGQNTPKRAGAVRDGRVLWIGQPSVLPVAGWPLGPEAGPGMAYATTDGLPGAASVWVGAEHGAVALLPQALASARAGDTSRLGRMLAPMGISYVVFVNALAPQPYGRPDRPADSTLADAFGSQLDLVEVKVNPALRVFRNDVALPIAAGITPLAAPVEFRHSGVWNYGGPVVTGQTVLLSQAFSDRWSLTVSGQSVSPTPSDGWANSFVSPATGNAKIAYENSGRRRLVSVGQILLWSGAVASLSARRGWREALPWGKAKRRRSNLVTPDELLQTDGRLERAVDLVSQRTPAGDADAQLGADPQLGSEAK